MLPEEDPRTKTENLRNKANRYTEEFESTSYSKNITFGSIFNNSTLTLELLDLYYGIWKNATVTVGQDIDLIKKQNFERVILITKWLFIFSLSGIESSIKKLILNSKNTKLNDLKLKIKSNNKIHLDQILKNMKDTQRINLDQYNNWATAIYVRNVMIHNDGIAYDDADYFLKDFKIHLEKNKMMQGKIDFFIDITDRLMEIYREFLTDFKFDK